jgi:hypothetical protein
VPKRLKITINSNRDGHSNVRGNSSHPQDREDSAPEDIDAIFARRHAFNSMQRTTPMCVWQSTEESKRIWQRACQERTTQNSSSHCSVM